MKTAPLIPAALAALVASTALFPASAKEHRSREVTREFQREQPCPSTGAEDAPAMSKINRAAGVRWPGSDAVGNMQWQTISAAKAKDRWERRGCP
jgi:hypothetical protein